MSWRWPKLVMMAPGLKNCKKLSLIVFREIGSHSGRKFPESFKKHVTLPRIHRTYLTVLTLIPFGAYKTAALRVK